MSRVERLTVALGERAYEILVGEGLLAEAAERIAAALPGRRLVVVTDETVAALHLPALAGSLAAAGLDSPAIVLPPGEATKDFGHLQDLTERLLDARVDRGSVVVAFGGGVIGDLAGLAAALTLRGLDFVQIPTTLLAQVDSSVGGKTGINTRQGKNLVGAFHQPRLVLADTGTLSTLPKRELLAGYAEVVKYGLIADPAFFAWLEAQGPALIAGDPEARRRAVLTACAAKAAIVAEDERERGKRALLNLGHTFGPCPGGRGPATAATCCTARRWPSGWCWPSTSRCGWGSARPRTRPASGATWPRSACRPGSRPCRCGPVARRPAAPHGARQEGAGRPRHLRPAAGHRPGLPGPRGRAGGRAGPADPRCGGLREQR